VIERDAGGLRVSGPLTIANVAALAESGKQQFGDGGELLIDLAGATEVDSAALSLLLEWRREARRRNTRLSFRNLPPSLQSLAALYGVSEFIAADG
jgi:phospholipid transport system transporter-binding protein